MEGLGPEVAVGLQWDPWARELDGGEAAGKVLIRDFQAGRSRCCSGSGSDSPSGRLGQ